MGTQRKLIHNLFPQRDVLICRYTPLVLFGNPTFPYSVLHFMLLDGFILLFFSQLLKTPPLPLTEDYLASYFTERIEQSEENVHMLDHQVTNLLTG